MLLDSQTNFLEMAQNSLIKFTRAVKGRLK